MIRLNYRDAGPIYEQIADNFKKIILSGALGDNEKLPSVRTLASDLSINPNTIQRAYNELEAAGYIYSIPGKGSFVAKRAEMKNVRIGEIKEEIQSLVRELRDLSVGENEIEELFMEGKND